MLELKASTATALQVWRTNQVCPGGFSAVLWSAVRRMDLIRDFFEWKILTFIHIHAKYVRWASATLYLQLVCVSLEYCCRENFPCQSLWWCLILYFSTALLFLSNSKYTCYLSSLSWVTYLTLMYYLSLRCCSCFFLAQGSSLQYLCLINIANTSPSSPMLPFMLE